MVYFNSRILALFIIPLAILLTLLANVVTPAQTSATTGVIVGVVHDSTAAVIPGATVTARQSETNLTRVMQSDEQGVYRFIQLPPGKYEIKAESNNFSSQTQLTTLALGTTALLEFTLTPLGTSDVVLVEANSSTEPQTESSTNIERTRLENLPSLQRSSLGLALISPRVNGDQLPKEGVVVTSGLSINGQSARFNNVTIDGLDNNDYLTGSTRSLFSQDGIQEFQIITDSYSAEFGRVLGGIVNLVTRGGSNQFHSEIFLFDTNDQLAARNSFAKKKPELNQYQFGGILSGPLRKDRTFFFTSYERLTTKQSKIITISDMVVRSAQAQGFDLRNGPVPFSVGTNSLLARIDSQISANNRFWLRYNGGFTYNGDFQSFGGLRGESFGGIQRLDDNSIAFSNTYLNAGLGLANETRLLFGRRNQKITEIGEDTQIQIDAREGKLIFGRNGFLPQNRQEDIVQLVDNVSLSRGRNLIKFGVDLDYTNIGSLVSPFLLGGLAIFNPFTADQLPFPLPNPMGINPVALFDPNIRTPQQIQLLNMLTAFIKATDKMNNFSNLSLANSAVPTSFVQAFGDPRGSSNYKFFSMFAQDELRLRSNILINIGLRYDVNAVKFAPATKTKVSPRLAIAYQPTKLPQLNIRAAYGLFVGAPLAGVILDNRISQQLAITVAPFPFSVLAYNSPNHKIPNNSSLKNQLAKPQLSEQMAIDPQLDNSYAQQATLSLDYSLNKDTKLSLSYNYVRGLKLFGSRNINPIVHPFPMNAIKSATLGRVDNTRGNVFELESAFDSNYHAFTATFEQHLSNRLTLLTHYTLAKAIDNVVDFFPLFQEIANPLNIGQERALSIQDVRSRFVFSANLNLNYSKRLLLKDFQLATIATFASGRPYNLLAGVDLDRNGDFPPADRPLNIGRNAGITPGFANIDLRLSRLVTWGEKTKLNAFVEVFNLANRTNINPNEISRVFLPNRKRQFLLPPQKNGRFIVPPANYRGSFDARQFQLGFRLSF